MCILHPGDILALNEICGSFQRTPLGPLCHPTEPDFQVSLEPLGVHTLHMLQMQVPDLLTLLAPSESQLYLKPSLQHFSQEDFALHLPWWHRVGCWACSMVDTPQKTPHPSPDLGEGAEELQETALHSFPATFRLFEHFFVFWARTITLRVKLSSSHCFFILYECSLKYIPGSAVWKKAGAPKHTLSAEEKGGQASYHGISCGWNSVCQQLHSHCPCECCHPMASTE